MKKIFKKLFITSILSFSLISLFSCKNNGEYITEEEKEEFEIIEFGSFAQSVVTDENIINVLDEITLDKDEIYLDTLEYINLDGNNYVKQNVNPYKNIFNKAQNYAFYKYDPDKDEEQQHAYFKVEPIKFIKRNYKDEILYISEDILFCEQFSANTTSKYDEDGTYFPNNYIKSDLRTYLNEDFYNMAFTEEEKLLINDHITENDLSSAAPGASSNYLPNKDCIDKIFIPSYDEIDKMFTNNISRSASTSDFARCQGTALDISGDYYGNGYYLTRSSYKKLKDYVNFVNNSGKIINDKFDFGKVQNENNGIRIILSLNI